jgi:hypothetical protein
MTITKDEEEALKDLIRCARDLARAYSEARDIPFGDLRAAVAADCVEKMLPQQRKVDE